MSDWTSLDDIMRDLSVAQGHVPASLETFNNTGPPTLNIEEETEEMYYKECGANGHVDFSKPPDIKLIQEMLSMVTDKTESPGDSMFNSDLNPLSPEFVPQSKNATSFVKKTRPDKNVAMQSIIEAQNREVQANGFEQLELFKRPVKNMFRKRSRDSNAAVMQTAPKKTSLCQYTPSMLANQYYNKYLEKSKVKEQMQEDIWTRAEREMRMIDERNKRKRQSSSSSTQDYPENGSGSSNTSTLSGMDYVSMPYHRHLTLDSDDDCVVCKVARKHGYTFDNEVFE